MCVASITWSIIGYSVAFGGGSSASYVAGFGEHLTVTDTKQLTKWFFQVQFTSFLNNFFALILRIIFFTFETTILHTFPCKMEEPSIFP